MKKKLLAVIAVAFVLTGCSASNSNAALDACKKAAEDQVGASINMGDIEATNMGDALYEAGITEEKKTDDANALFTAAGDFTYQADGSEIRKTMICSVKFDDGQPGTPELSIT